MIDLDQAKAHLRVRHEDEDALIQAYIEAANAWLVRYTGDNYDETAGELMAAELLLVGHFYNNREAVSVGSPVHEVPLAVEALAGPFRTPTVV